MIGAHRLCVEWIRDGAIHDSLGSFMSLETTVLLDGQHQDARSSCLNPESSGQSLLLTFHDRFGQARQPYLPPEPPTAIAWNAEYEVIKQLGQGAQGVVYLARRDGVDG